MAKVLITRLSSFGDVAMLVPVVFSVAAHYPQDRFVVLTRKSFAPLFENLGFNISAVTFDPGKNHKGFFGTLKLLRTVLKYGYSHVVDEHDVLRTKLIRFVMRLFGKKVAYIDKGRAEKKEMIATKDVSNPLKYSYDRYMDVFDRIGFPAEMVFNNFFEFSERSLYPLRAVVKEKVGKWIGVAPFSKHDEKIYPLDKMEQVVEDLSGSSVTVFLFGSGAKEREVLEAWESKYTNVISIDGKLNLMNELLLISYLDVMISMDSANMHLASLVETPVVSIWGATHPSLGFYGFRQDLANAVQIDGLPCRPCSVFGDIPCERDDFACLNTITKEQIIDKVDQILYGGSRDELESDL